MRKYLLAGAMSVAMISTPALADGNNRGTDTEVFQLRANNPAKCNLEAADYTLRIAGNSISDNNGFARTTVSAAVANEMNGAGVTAWCTGSTNIINMYRTAFTTDDGVQGSDGFNKAVVYDVAMDIADATRTPGNTHPTEGTSDGKGNGPGIGAGSGIAVSRFGPSGPGSAVTFTAEDTSEAVSDGVTPADGARSDFAGNTNRLVAGQYESTLTIEITPQV